jgi:hypothetical protein
MGLRRLMQIHNCTDRPSILDITLSKPLSFLTVSALRAAGSTVIFRRLQKPPRDRSQVVLCLGLKWTGADEQERQGQGTALARHDCCPQS